MTIKVVSLGNLQTTKDVNGISGG